MISAEIANRASLVVAQEDLDDMVSRRRERAMSDNTFQWSFVGVIVLAIVLIIMSAVGAIPAWVIAIALIGGIAGGVALVRFWGTKYMSRY
ncbi:MAG: hypothetical protein A2Y91_02465 [Chloroflexi bacterium RBG_13_54_8]|nr:MAG: hypothetical protein A2Y91_02465 [Chloroflexi bacterium RBG_13_54_8]